MMALILPWKVHVGKTSPFPTGEGQSLTFISAKKAGTELTAVFFR
jgi:hypothetical protein